MAEFLMKKLVRQAGREGEFEIASAATSAEELGNPVYPLARQELAMHGIGCGGHTARQVKADDYARYDLIVAMDAANVRSLEHCFGGDPEGKITLMMALAGEERDVADPWYTRNFRKAWNDIHAGCTALLEKLTANDGTAD